MPRLLQSVTRAFVDRASVDWNALLSRSASTLDHDFITSLHFLDSIRQGTPQEPVARAALRQTFHPLGIVLGLATLQTASSIGLLLIASANGEAPTGRSLQFPLTFAFFLASVVLAVAPARNSSALPLLIWFSCVTSLFARSSATGLPPQWLAGLNFTGHGVFLEAFLPACLWHFAQEFPRTRRFTIFDSLARRATTMAWLLGVLLFGINLISAHYPVPLGIGRYLLRDDPSSAFWHLITLWLCPAVITIFARAHRAPAPERAKVARLATAIGIGTAPFLTVGIVGAASPRFNHWIFTTSLSDRIWLDLVVVAGFVATPLLTVAAILIDRPFELRSTLRRAFRFALARHALLALLIAPFVVAGLRLYQLRRVTLADLFASTEAWLLLGCASIATILIIARPHLLRFLDQRESRRRTEHQQQLAAALERIRLARGRREIGAVLERELRDGTGAAFVRVLTATPSAGFADLAGRTTALAAQSALVAMLADAAQLLDVSTDGPLLPLLPAADREWVEANAVALLTPITHRDDTIAGIVALGPKRGGVKFDDRDQWLLTTMTAAAAAAWDEPLAGPAEAAHLWDRSKRGEAAFECPACGLVSNSVRLSCGCGTEATIAALPRHVGDHLVVTRRIGAGGMGVVYLAHDTTLNRDVALKTLSTLAPGVVPRLRDEARVMAALNHPELATIYELQTWRRTPILVVEYFPQGTLADRLARGPLPVMDVIALATRVAAALGVMHAAHMRHGDLKPSNIALSARGPPKLLDFGLASLITTDVRVQGARVAGTPAYLPPEAYDGSSPRAAWDLWALAVVVLEASLGVNPFAGRDRASTIRRITTPHDGHAILQLSLAPRELRAFAARALDPEVARRYQSAAEMQAALEHVTARGFA